MWYYFFSQRLHYLWLNKLYISAHWPKQVHFQERVKHLYFHVFVYSFEHIEPEIISTFDLSQWEGCYPLDNFLLIIIFHHSFSEHFNDDFPLEIRTKYLDLRYGKHNVAKFTPLHTLQMLFDNFRVSKHTFEVFPELNASLHIWINIWQSLRNDDWMINVSIEIRRTLYKTFYMLDYLVPKLNILLG